MAQLFKAFRVIVAQEGFLAWLRKVPNSKESDTGMCFCVGRWGRLVPDLSDLASATSVVPGEFEVEKIKESVARVRAEAILVRDGANVTINRLAVSMLGDLNICVRLEFDCEDTDANGLIEPTVVFQHERFVISCSS